jgi:hypothetical protein
MTCDENARRCRGGQSGKKVDRRAVGVSPGRLTGPNWWMGIRRKLAEIKAATDCAGGFLSGPYA